MCDISVEKCADAKVLTITMSNRRLFWVKMCDVQKRLGFENIYDLLKKEIWGIYGTNKPKKEQRKQYKRREKELNYYSSSRFRYARSDIILKIIMYCRKTEKAVEFKTKLGFNPINLIMSKEEAVTTIIMKSFVGVKMIEQYPVLSKKIDLYIPDHKLATEIDEKRHIDSKKKIK